MAIRELAAGTEEGRAALKAFPGRKVRELSNLVEPGARLPRRIGPASFFSQSAPLGAPVAMRRAPT